MHQQQKLIVSTMVACSVAWLLVKIEHRFLECSETQGSNFSRAPGGREHITPELRVEPSFNLEFENHVQTLEFGTLCSNSGSETSPRVRTLGSETPCLNLGFEEL